MIFPPIETTIRYIFVPETRLFTLAWLLVAIHELQFRVLVPKAVSCVVERYLLFSTRYLKSDLVKSKVSHLKTYTAHFKSSIMPYHFVRLILTEEFYRLPPIWACDVAALPIFISILAFDFIVFEAHFRLSFTTFCSSRESFTNACVYPLLKTCQYF